MVLKVIQQNTIEDTKFYVDVGIPETPFYTTDPWFRNPCWLSLPTVTNTEQKFVGLLAIDPDVNDVRLIIEMDTSLDSFRVDWGDGVIEDFIDPSTASTGSALVQHSYDYNNVLFNGTDAPVTFTASTNTVNRTSHGYSNEMFITFAEITTTPEIDRNRTYWVVNATANTFQIATTKNGTPLDFTMDGSGKILPYKQAIVTVTPIQGRITIFRLNARHTNMLDIIYDVGWLDVVVSLPYVTTMSFTSPANPARIISLNRLEQISILNSGLVLSLAYLFYLFTNLQSIPILHVPDTTTSLNSIFSGCRRLKTIPTFNTKNVQDVGGMFSSCTSLEEAPFLDLKNCYITNSMFFSCHSLKSVPLYDISNVYNIGAMFQNCFNLKQIPKYDTASVRFMADTFNGCTSVEVLPHLETKRCSDFTRAFQSCYMLKTIQGLDTRNATTTLSMFADCHKLRTVPKMDMQNVVNASSMFSGCYSIVTIPEMQFDSLVYASSMFTNCHSLERIYDITFSSPNLVLTPSMFSQCYSIEKSPAMNTSKVTNVSSMFANCNRLREVPDMDLSSCINFTSMFNSCVSLERAPRMITTATGSGNPYVKPMDSMFTSCVNLKYVPPFDTSKTSTVANMFYICHSLEVAPEFDLSMCTNTFRMFRDCLNLKKVGKISNATNVTTFGDIFYNCLSLNEIPEMDCNGVTVTAGFSTAFLNCNSVIKFNATNLNYTFSVASNKLSGAALNELYTSLPTVTGQTLTVTGHWGTATDNPAIATAKGWTVTG